MQATVPMPSGVESKQAQKQWVKSGLLTAMGLAKALPETAAALKDGTVEAHDLALYLVGIELQDHYNVPSGMSEIQVIVSGIVKFFNRETLLDGSSDSPLAPLQEKFMEEMTDEIFANITQTKHIFYQVVDIQRAYLQVAGRWKPLIQRLTGRSLKDTCYTSPRDEFGIFIVFMTALSNDEALNSNPKRKEELESRFITKYTNIKKSAEGVINDDDLVKKICWECGKKDEHVLKCSRCCTARYCSKDCQRKSWAEGHKQKCKELKKSHSDFRESLGFVRKVMKGGVLLEGILPNTRMAYEVARNIFMAQQLIKTIDNECIAAWLEKFQGPSMEIFYKNLNSIIRGETHWLSSGTVNLEAANSSDTLLSENGELTSKALVDWYYTAFLMAFDASNTSETDKKALQKIVWNLFMKEAFDGEYDTMAAERFLKIFHSGSHLNSSQRVYTAKESREDAVREIFNILREHVHKD